MSINSIEDAKAAIRRMESGSDYKRQQAIRANGRNDMKVGAYGMLESRWGQLADAAGLSGADWHDRKAQDVIAARKLKRDYEALGSWELAVVAFRYGTPVATFFKDNDMTHPKSMEAAGYEDPARYLRDIRRNVSDPERPVIGDIKQPVPPGGEREPSAPSPTRKRSEDIVRQRLVGMRNAQRSRTPDEPEAAQETVEPAAEVTDGI